MPAWNDFEIFTAPGRDKNIRMRFIISKEFIDTHTEINKLTPLFQTTAHLYGRLPNINLISRVEDADPTPTLMTLDDASACYEGIKRPLDDENNGSSVLIYILKPDVTIERSASMTCMARAAIPPNNSVLTVLVRTNQGLQDDCGDIDGCVTRLEWVFSGDNDFLPKDADTRYDKKYW